MSLALILACLWVLASAIVAMLPYRMQFPPGIALLILAFPLVGFVGYSHGWIWAAIIVFAVLSMYRNPLRYMCTRALRRET
ncbi:DUF2484 family protein [Gymnodinialimonas ceratoperidinii]|uniref:DUF2484 family protein n=1 Tax=Gymnodinialimonas ceratoperidinii TaxID=2856823 RepID=A0A8F6TYI6_9RHOB|nr:DUF2484 family protein [Gymnodinialimonas ceratoperidinii]QXT41262.1 DUF2484 family protein [Gymnodinialimonas ceratoperidinii]